MEIQAIKKKNRNYEWISKKLGLEQRISLSQLFYNFLYYPIACIKKRQAERDIPKSDSHTYTAFYRSPGQLDLLVGAVAEYLGVGKNSQNRSLIINVVAGSSGAEAYSMASVLLAKFPDLDFEIFSSDLHDATVAKGKAGVYAADEINKLEIPEEFINNTFDFDGKAYRVKDHIRRKVRFFKANIIADDLGQIYPKGDIICIQNVLFHLADLAAYQAFTNTLATAKEKSVIFMDGMSLSMRLRLVRQHKLVPFTENLKQIHEEARRHIPRDWWNYYYGLEPYLFFIPNKSKRYGTVFRYDLR